jgi:hypothetical protein
MKVCIMTEKVYKVAGIATDKRGNTKVRYANNLVNRIKVLSRDSFTNINLIELDDYYDKFEICQMLLSDNRFTDYIDIINNELDRLNRISDDYSVKLIKKQRKLALANISAEDILNIIK